MKYFSRKNKTKKNKTKKNRTKKNKTKKQNNITLPGSQGLSAFGV